MLIGGFRRTKKGKHDVMEIPCFVDASLLLVRRTECPGGQKVSLKKQMLTRWLLPCRARIAYFRLCLPLCLNGNVVLNVFR